MVFEQGDTETGNLFVLDPDLPGPPRGNQALCTPRLKTLAQFLLIAAGLGSLVAPKSSLR